jgi:hypothetical protein
MQTMVDSDKPVKEATEEKVILGSFKSSITDIMES